MVVFKLLEKSPLERREKEKRMSAKKKRLRALAKESRMASVSSQQEGPSHAPPKVQEGDKTIQIDGSPHWLRMGWYKSKPHIVVDIYYFDSDGVTPVPYEAPKHIIFVPIPGQTLYLPRYHKTSARIILDFVRNFGEFWACKIPDGYVPIDVKPLDAPLDFSYIKVKKGERGEWDERLTQLKQEVIERSNDEYKAFLTAELEKKFIFI